MRKLNSEILCGVDSLLLPNHCYRDSLHDRVRPANTTHGLAHTRNARTPAHVVEPSCLVSNRSASARHAPFRSLLSHAHEPFALPLSLPDVIVSQPKCSIKSRKPQAFYAAIHKYLGSLGLAPRRMSTCRSRPHTSSHNILSRFGACGLEHLVLQAAEGYPWRL